MLQDAQLVGQISRHLMRTLDFILSKGSPPYPRKAKLSAKKKKKLEEQNGKTGHLQMFLDKCTVFTCSAPKCVI